MGIPVMSNSLMLADSFEDTPTGLDEKRKDFIIRHLIGEVDWSGTNVLVVDMPPGTGEEVRGLLKLGQFAVETVAMKLNLTRSGEDQLAVQVVESETFKKMCKQLTKTAKSGSTTG